MWQNLLAMSFGRSWNFHAMYGANASILINNHLFCISNFAGVARISTQKSFQFLIFKLFLLTRALDHHLWSIETTLHDLHIYWRRFIIGFHRYSNSNFLTQSWTRGKKLYCCEKQTLMHTNYCGQI